ncbi:MAG: radical SAM protein [Planctomycetota bacterium]|jgi:cyclic pyranopterin phosphate synthase|nr:radical SAM protein [Planctomycetota bacterium]
MYLRVSLLEACNLRCRYCLPADAKFSPPATTPDELLRLTRLVTEAAGVHKIRITGGEPTLCPELLEHVSQAAALAPIVGMTSNGIRLAPLIEPLQRAGLNRLNISLDAPDEAGFEQVTRRTGHSKVLTAIRAAMAAGFDPIKLNCVATADTRCAAMLDLARREGVHLRFIELMAIGVSREVHAKRFLSSEQIRARLFLAGEQLAVAADRDEPTSRVWTVHGTDPSDTTLGFITTVSNPFCGTCDRIRLTSAGRLHTCLFDQAGTDLLSPLRLAGDEAVREAVRHAVAGKAPPVEFVRSAAMAAIGG